MAEKPLPPEYLPEDFDPIVTFKDGTVIKARCGYNEVTDEIWIWPTDEMTFSDAAILFSNPAKTDHIRADHSSMEYDEYDGYTKLKTINIDIAGKMSVRLIKGSD